MEEFVERFKYFKDSLAAIAKLNANEDDPAEYAINHLADLSPEEFKQLRGYQKNDEELLEVDFAEIPDIELPESFDWRDHNAVTPVKNQGGCGSCWAFSVVGNIEGQYAIKHKKLVSFSEQEVLSCSGTPCQRGNTLAAAYETVEKLGGIETEQSYPYVSEHGVNYPCKFKKNEVVGKVSGFKLLSSNEDDMAKWLVQNGPIAVAVDASGMQGYKSGIYKPSNNPCSDRVDHGVLVVGFGVKDGTKYWIIKNSWGEGWGMDGYIFLERGVGACSVNSEPFSGTIV